MRSLQLGMGWLTQQAGGLNRYAFGLSHALANLGVAQTWLVTAEQPIVGEASAIDVRAVASPTAPLRKRWAAFQVAMREVMAESTPPDLAASHFALYAFPLRKQLASMPHVVHFHGPWAAETRAEGAPAWKCWLQKQQELAIYRTADRVITLSRAFAKIAIQDYGVPEDRVRVIAGGVEFERFHTGRSRREARDVLHLPHDRPIAVCVRRLAQRMGIPALVAAAAQVVKQQPDLLLLIGGKGALQNQLQAQIEQLGIQNNVRLLGFIADEELPLYYTASDFSIVPTQSLEGFGLIVLESLAAGTPVLVTPVGGLPEILQPFAPQLILADRTAEAIQTGMLAALRGDLVLPSADECREYVEQNFRWDRVARNVLKVYQEAIAAK